MHWEVWDIESGNLVGWRESEPEALALVADVVAKGWPIEALSLAVEDDARPVETLPPALTGQALAERVALILGERRRSA